MVLNERVEFVCVWMPLRNAHPKEQKKKQCMLIYRYSIDVFTSQQQQQQQQLFSNSHVFCLISLSLSFHHPPLSLSLRGCMVFCWLCNIAFVLTNIWNASECGQLMGPIYIVQLDMRKCKPLIITNTHAYFPYILSLAYIWVLLVKWMWQFERFRWTRISVPLSLSFSPNSLFYSFYEATHRFFQPTNQPTN